jgi:GNAT superfamily N-acetyltransferase
MNRSTASRSESRNLRIEPLTLDLWPALEELFGDRGACNGCWCMHWRIGPEYRKRLADFRKVVKAGPPPGLLAFEDDRAVGWCQVTPRDVLPWLDHTWRLRRVDGIPVWSITCFYIRIGHRRQGITRALIRAALTAARHAGAPALEAYPLDAALSPSATSTGYASTFARLGFKEVARHSPERPIFRYELTGD